MTTDPYDHATDETFDQIINHARHPGGHTMSRDTTAEDKHAQVWQMLGCSSLVLAVALAVAVITLAWRL